MRNVLRNIILLIALSSCAVPGALPDRITTVAIGGKTVTVTEAITRAEITKGLAGVTDLPDDRGMLFRFDDTRVRSFWMRDMIIPIDIIWINGNRIIGIEKYVPIEDVGVPLADLPRYTSPEPADFVLEVMAGFADTYGVKAGDTVTYR